MNLWHLVFRTDSLTYTICRALRECNYEVSVWVADPEYGTRVESGIQKRLAETEGIHVFGGDSSRVPQAIDRLIVQTFPRPAEAVKALPLLAPRARAITLISSGDRSRCWSEAMKLQWLETRTLGALVGKVDRIVYKDGFHGIDLFRSFRRRDVIGFDAHSQFLHLPDLFSAMHACDWNADDLRPVLVSFLGSQDPGSRKAILDSVRHLFHTPSGGARSPRPGKSMFWHEYSDAEPAGVPPADFVDMLTRSDFTLCPRGYSLITHRPIEAMLRGSIPVLSADELDLYGVELVDSRTCIAVEANGWPAAIERICQITEREISGMRNNILSMREPVLEYPQLASRICARLGLPPR